jgi:putative transposase
MPQRQVPIVPGEIYHVFNRSIAREPIFLSDRHYQRAIDVIEYDRYFDLPFRFSHYNRLASEQKKDILRSLQIKAQFKVEVFAFCLMPNHFHFLLKEIKEGGIRNFIGNFQNGYAKYFNIRHDRTGSLFQSRFKAVRIETDEQFLHVVRYVHLNPYTGYVIKTLNELEMYKWSSFQEYIKQQYSIISAERVMNYFPSPTALKEFTFQQADYQRELDVIKHLILE